MGISGMAQCRLRRHRLWSLTLAPSAIAAVATVGDRAVAGADLRSDSPAAAGRWAGDQGQRPAAAAQAPESRSRSTSVWRIAVSPRRLASPYVPPVDRLRSPRPSKP